MKKNDKDILKKGMLETGADFTSKLMNQLEQEEKALANVLSSHGAMETSPDFTARLMLQLEGETKMAAYKPVISKFGWMGIAAFFVGIVLLVAFSGSSESSGLAIDATLEKIAEGLSTFFTKNKLFTYSLTGILILSLGLLVEQRVEKLKIY